MDGRTWLALWLATGGNVNERLERKEILKTVVSRTATECKICLATKNGDALEQNIFVIVKMICSGMKIYG